MTHSLRAEDLLRHFTSTQIISSTLTRLKSELSPQYCYHTVAHTLDVLSEALVFAAQANLCYQDLYLLSIAAAFHDIGFLVNATNNEQIGATMAREALAHHSSFSDNERDLISQMILDTTLQKTEEGLKQIATTHLSPFLLDADVSNFGRKDFLEKAELVRIEIGAPDRFAFLRGTVKLLEAHEWYSDAARELRFEQKKINLENLKQIIELERI